MAVPQEMADAPEETMTLHHADGHQPKGLVEHGACFGLAAAALVIAAVLLQWILNLTP
jgi:hypothetical protein